MSRPVNLFISPADRPASAGEEFRTMRGYNLLHWVRAGMEYWAVSDLSAGDLRDFAQRLQ